MAVVLGGSGTGWQWCENRRLQKHFSFHCDRLLLLLFGLLMCICKYPKSSSIEIYLNSMLIARRESAVCRVVVEHPEVNTAGGINQYRRT